MPSNRFLNSHQLTENEFYGIVYDFILGVNAEACSERIGVGADSVRDKYRKLRERIGNDPDISGSLASLPPGNDPVWNALHFCIFKCLGSVDKPYAFSPFNLSMFFSSRDAGKNINVVGRDRKTKCEKCSLGEPFEIDYNLQYTLQLQRSAMKGYGQESFRNFYIEAVLRSIALQNRKEKSTTFNQYARAILQSCVKNPL